jgi:hypothetical protein
LEVKKKKNLTMAGVLPKCHTYKEMSDIFTALKFPGQGKEGAGQEIKRCHRGQGHIQWEKWALLLLSSGSPMPNGWFSGWFFMAARKWVLLVSALGDPICFDPSQHPQNTHAGWDSLLTGSSTLLALLVLDGLSLSPHIHSYHYLSASAPLSTWCRIQGPENPSGGSWECDYSPHPT